MPSANGYKLVYGKHTLIASWPAQFFVLVTWPFEEDANERPLLIHCEGTDLLDSPQNEFARFIN